MSQPVTPDCLWTVKDLIKYLARSERWIRTALRRQDADPGSIPHYRLPGGAPRFDPGEIESWVKSGCPPTETFRTWKSK